MDPNYLSQQVNTIIGQLHGLFDEIGVPNHDRETREAELFAALSEALNNQVHIVAAEKKEMVEEAQRIITTIRQMEASLDDSKSRRDRRSQDDDLRVTYPLTRCLQTLKEKLKQISRIHRERFEQVKKLVQALESYSSHLEPSFVKIALPPTAPDQSIPPSFDLSPPYVDKLDNEFTRVYEEYTQRVSTVQTLSENIIQLWAELGIPQAQTDGAIVKYYRDSPEQLGLHEDDITRLRAKRDKLAAEKKNREKRLQDLKIAVEALWEKLGVEEHERKAFLNGNRGCGVRQINEFEGELGRLNELKRQNLHLFVEDAREKLQELWDSLYFSEDEMLDFSPAFSDVYSDALLEAHEREIARLETLKEQRAPTLALVDRHKSLVTEQNNLATSSQDASRLMLRGQKGEKRDPGKLLREEKMRKRITKELPKVAAELRKILEQWEEEYGRPFLVYGERYLDAIEAEDSKGAPGPRAKTPAGGPLLARGNSTSTTKPAMNRANSVGKPAPPSRSGAKTPTYNSFPTRKGQAPAQTTISNKGSPSRIPARAPLSNLKNATNSLESRGDGDTLRRSNVPMMRAPPPKMRELFPVPELEAPANHRRPDSSIVRHVEPEDVYDDRPQHEVHDMSRPVSHHDFRDYPGHASLRGNPQYERFTQSYSQAQQAQPAAIRQISNDSSNSGTVISGSENWETYDDNSEPEQDATDTYYAKVRAARSNSDHEHPQPAYGRGYSGIAPAKRPQRGIPPTNYAGHAMVDNEGNRIVSKGSEWTDEDAF